MCGLKSTPSGINAERAQNYNHREQFEPPRVAPHCGSKSIALNCGSRLGHRRVYRNVVSQWLPSPLETPRTAKNDSVSRAKNNPYHPKLGMLKTAIRRASPKRYSAAESFGRVLWTSFP